MSRARAAVLSICLLAPSAGWAGEQRWAIGLQVDPLAVPGGHQGIPVQTIGNRVGLAFSARYRGGDWWALNLGLGFPQSALGAGAWFGHEMFHPLWSDQRRIVELELFEDAAAQLSFVGPDYYARHGGTFVGRYYAFGGPLAAATRLSVGLRATWLDGRFDTSLEGISILQLTPSFDSLSSVDVGVRLHF